MISQKPGLTLRPGFFFELTETSTSQRRQMAYNPQDRYFKKAKLEGYRSRAAYKLIELQQRFRLIRPGDAVVDLGAAPGGWLQVAGKAVGSQGKVIGVDLQSIKPFNQGNIILFEGDITDPAVQEKIKELIGGPADSILSDLAPKLSGIRDADMARCFELNQTALQVAIELLRPGGSLLIKSFISTDLQTFTADAKTIFFRGAANQTGSDAPRFLRVLFLCQGICSFAKSTSHKFTAVSRHFYARAQTRSDHQALGDHRLGKGAPAAPAKRHRRGLEREALSVLRRP